MMKKWLSIALIALLIPTQVFSIRGPKESLRQFIENNGDRNLLINPGFESGKQDWNVGGNLSTGNFGILNNSTVVGLGFRSYFLISAGQGEYVESDPYVVPRGLWGAKCIGTISYNWSTGTANDLELVVIDHAGNELTSEGLDASSNYREKTVGFICPSGGSIKLRVDRGATVADGILPAIHLDGMSLGKNDSTSPDFGVETLVQSGVKVCSLKVTVGTAGALVRDDGGCVDSMATGTAGIGTLTWKSGYWKTIPNCSHMINSGSHNSDMHCRYQSDTTTSMALLCYDDTNATNMPTTMVCVGE
jgi:hypothetical protein